MQQVRAKAAHSYKAVHDTFYSVKAVFEKHNVVFTIGASLASAGAAWAGYTARQMHQKKVEDRLNSIEHAMTTVHNLEEEQVKALTKGIGVSYPGCAATAATTLIIGYGFGFRGGRRYALNRIRKQQQRLLNPPTPSRLSQVFQKRRVKNSVEKSLEPVIRSSEVATQPLEASGLRNSVSK